MFQEIMSLALGNGLWAALFCLLFLYQLKDSRLREKKYAETIDSLTAGLSGVRDIKRDCEEIASTLIRIKSGCEAVAADSASIKSDTTAIKSDSANIKSESVSIKADTEIIKADCAFVKSAVARRRGKRSDDEL